MHRKWLVIIRRVHVPSNYNTCKGAGVYTFVECPLLIMGKENGVSGQQQQQKGGEARHDPNMCLNHHTVVLSNLTALVLP